MCVDQPEADTRLLVFAGEDASGDRYFNKTLEELDKVSLVRDRTGSGLAASADQSDADMSSAEDQEVVSSPSGSTPPPTSEANKRAEAKAAEWGVGKSSGRSSTMSSPPSDEEDTEDERQTLREQEQEEEEEEDYEEDVS